MTLITAITKEKKKKNERKIPESTASTLELKRTGLSELSEKGYLMFDHNTTLAQIITNSLYCHKKLVAINYKLKKPPVQGRVFSQDNSA